MTEKSKEANIKYIYHILKFNQENIYKLQRGSAQPHVYASDLSEIPIPNPNIETQNKIIEIMKDANLLKEKLEKEADKLLSSIDEYLLRELGINLPKKETDLKNRIFIKKANDLIGKRIDIFGYLPFYKHLKENIQNTKYSYKKLKDLITHTVIGNWGLEEKDIEENKKDKFKKCLIIRSTEFGEYDLNIDSKRKQYRFIEKEKLHKLNICSGDILIEKSGGSENQPVGRVVFLTDEFTKNKNICFSNFIQKITLNNELNKKFVFYCLHTFHSIKLTENMQSQTNGIKNLILSEYYDIPIPLPPIEIQQKIVNEINERKQKALRLQKEAKEILEDAKSQVERIIF